MRMAEPMVQRLPSERDRCKIAEVFSCDFAPDISFTSAAKIDITPSDRQLTTDQKNVLINMAASINSLKTPAKVLTFGIIEYCCDEGSELSKYCFRNNLDYLGEKL